MWEIDRDYIKDKGTTGRVGTTGETINVGFGPIAPNIVDLPGGPVVRFRMLDDDDNPYYGGWLHNDNECLNQQAALAYGMNDAGCTIIEIKEPNTKDWKREIG